MRDFIKTLKATAIATAILSSSLFAEEGMWTFDNPPLQQLKEKYNFMPDKNWLEHIRLSSVRINDGGSGSFVSPYGLIMTNHHVALSQIQKLSSQDFDIVKNGFYAPNQGEELKCKDLEINVLMEMHNVTDQVNAVVNEDMELEEVEAAKRKAFEDIRSDFADKTGLRADKVDLYYGGEYWIYCYKKYTDIRLVFAPEYQAGFFGGAYDNFTYPRYNLDCTFLRVYEDGKPVDSKNYLKWNSNGVKADELVFMAGNPGTTKRLYTNDQLLDERDHTIPMLLETLEYTLDQLHKFADQSPENARQAQVNIMYLENSLKAYTGIYEGLQNKRLIKQHKDAENDLRSKIKANDELDDLYGDAWEEISEIMEEKQESYAKYFFHNLGRTSLMRYAGELQAWARETDKTVDKNEERIENLERSLLAPIPFYKDLEEVMLRSQLVIAAKNLDEDDPFLKAVLKGRTPEQAAKEIIAGSKIGDIEYRRQLLGGNSSSVENSDDTFLAAYNAIKDITAKEGKWYNENIHRPLSKWSEQIAKARFAVYGRNVYPDANFTPRLTYGTVKGFPLSGTLAPPFTTIYGLYDRALGFGNQGDFQVPERYMQRKDKVDMSTPCNFVSTCDIIGGNSGSPTFNKRGEIVGLVFDGNMGSLPGNFVYDYKENRALSVDARYMIEAFRKLYDANNLADELTK